MSSEQLGKLINAHPFCPFRIHMADGRSLEVKHRDFALRMPGGRSAIVANGDDSYEVFDLGLVTSFEVLSGATNGGPGPQ